MSRLAALDPVAATEFRAQLRRWRAQAGAILFTTHDLHEAVDTADRVVLLSAGRVVAMEEKFTDAAALERAIVSVVKK